MILQPTWLFLKNILSQLSSDQIILYCKEILFEHNISNSQMDPPPPKRRITVAYYEVSLSQIILHLQSLIIIIIHLDNIQNIFDHIRSSSAHSRGWKQRLSWSKFQWMLSADQVCCMFRMTE